MRLQAEARVWQVLGLLVVIAAALEIRFAAHQFTWTLNQKFAGIMDVLWPFAMGFFAGFLFLAGAVRRDLRRSVEGHDRRQTSQLDVEVRGRLVLFGGLLVVMLKMTNIAMSRQVRYGESPDFFGMLNNGDFAIAMSGVLFSSWG